MRTLETAVLAMLWMVTLWRAPSAFRTPMARSLWVAFASVTISMTLRRPEVLHAFDNTVGTHSAGTLLKHILGTVGAAAVLDFVITIARPEAARGIRPRHCLALASIAAMTAAFTCIDRSTEVDDLYIATAGTLWGTVYYSVFQTYLGVAMGVAGYLFLSSGRHAAQRWLRVSLRLLGAGTAIGIVYSLVRIGYLVLRLTGLTGTATIRLADTASNLSRSTAIGLILIGSSFPAVGLAWRQIHYYRTLRTLRPLWEALTTAAPGLVLRTSLLRSPRMRLHRVMIEIHDAGLALAPYAPGDLKERSRKAAEAWGHRGVELDAATKALWLRAAAQAKAAGAAPSTAAAASGEQESHDLDLDGEVAFLTTVALVYHSPNADTFLRTCQEPA